MKNVVLTVFIDGLKTSSIVHMPFLDSFPQKRRVRTDLGYSITCHATMYSGVYPNKHKMWFVWKYSPETSPFRKMPESQLFKYIDFLPSRYFLGKMARLFSNKKSYGGMGIMKRSSLRNWRYFDISESKFWDEDGYLDEYPTIFEILRKKKISYQTVGLVNSRMNGGALNHIQNYHVEANNIKWIYLFIGDVDNYSHFHTQESNKVINLLKKVDQEIERIYDELTEKYDNVDFFCFSDHGHMKVEHKFDIYEHFKSKGLNLDKYIHIIDTNYARFWFRDKREETEVREIMKTCPSGFFLSTNDYKKYHTQMPDNRYGDLIYYLDWPFMFKKTVWGYGLKTVSIHGFLPDYPDKDGVLISNLPIKKQGRIELPDILPSHLYLLNIKIDLEFDGVSIW